MEIVPAIDLIDSKVSRLVRGKFESPIHYEIDPVQYASVARGKVARLHVIDLDAAREGRRTRANAVLRAICDAFGPGVQIGGGVRCESDLRALRDLGATRVILGTLAARDPALVLALSRAHPGVILVGLDTRDGLITVDGWESMTSHRPSSLVGTLFGADLAGVIHTETTHDGMLAGPSLASLADVCRNNPWPVYVAGGVRSLDDLQALSRHPEVAGAIVGRALLEGAITLDEACACLASPA
jgi:phosphoribosylformimino-5-aminoimidazole carboxamide ribotide isomerase